MANSTGKAAPRGQAGLWDVLVGAELPSVSSLHGKESEIIIFLPLLNPFFSECGYFSDAISGTGGVKKTIIHTSCV